MTPYACLQDFGDSIPGHGGFTDRMDCQIIMGLFVYIYVTHVVSIGGGEAVSDLLVKAEALPMEQQVCTSATYRVTSTAWRLHSP